MEFLSYNFGQTTILSILLANNFMQLFRFFRYRLLNLLQKIIMETSSRQFNALTNSSELEQSVNTNLFPRQVIKSYKQLQMAVSNMDEKVELVMKKHQSEFLFAYRNHIKKIKKQLEQIKRKADEQQKIFSSNDRIRYLQKQVAVFRGQAINLYDKLEKQAIEITALKQNIKEAESEAQRSREETKQLTIKLKIRNLSDLEISKMLDKLTTQIESKNKKIQNLEKRLQQYTQRDMMKQSTYEGSQKMLTRIGSQNKEIKVYRNQLQDWFLECIRSVKKQIHLRKKNYASLDLSNIQNIAQFQLVDKLRLFELFLENQKLLNWFYHKIFPDRMDHLAQSLSQMNIQAQIQPKITKTTPNSSRYNKDNLNFELPKLNDKNRIRNSLQIKNGRMSLSSMG